MLSLIEPMINFSLGFYKDCFKNQQFMRQLAIEAKKNLAKFKGEMTRASIS